MFPREIRFTFCQAACSDMGTGGDDIGALIPLVPNEFRQSDWLMAAPTRSRGSLQFQDEILMPLAMLCGWFPVNIHREWRVDDSQWTVTWNDVWVILRGRSPGMTCGRFSVDTEWPRETRPPWPGWLGRHSRAECDLLGCRPLQKRRDPSARGVCRHKNTCLTVHIFLFCYCCLFVSFLFPPVFSFYCCYFFCYVSFIVSEVKLFVRHTLFFFSNCMSSSPISYSLLMST